MISRKLIEDALTPRGPQGPRVSLRRGEVVAPGMVSTEPDDLTGSPVDGPALDGSGAVLSIDGHRVFIPYAPSVPQELAERVEQAVQQATTAQEATNSTHVVAESAASTATAAVEAAAELSDAMDARDATIATIQDDVEDARQELAAAHGLASQASLDAAEANNAAAAAREAADAAWKSGQNLVPWGDFDTSATDHPYAGEGPWHRVIDPATAPPGHTAYMETTVTEGQAGKNWPSEMWIPVQESRTYRLSYWLWTDAPTDNLAVGFLPAWGRADGTEYNSYWGTIYRPDARTPPASGQWTQYSELITAPASDTGSPYVWWKTRVHRWQAGHTGYGADGSSTVGEKWRLGGVKVVDITEAASAIAAAEAAAQESADAVAAANSAITNVVPEYARNTSETDPPTSGWTTNPPGRLPGTFIWRRDRVTYGDSSTNTTPPVLTTGNTGPAGADGTSVAIKGRVATSSALPTTGVSDGDGYITEDTGHLWVRSGTTWIDAGLIRGPQGDPGTPGSPGADGVSVLTITPHYRRQLTSAAAPSRPTTMSPPSGWVTTEPEWQPLTSLWRTERIVYSNGDFAWTLVTKVAAWEIAAQALTSANGKNARITRTAAPTAANTTNPVTGGELVVGDTWWQVDSMTTLNAIGSWEWDGSAWVRTGITSEVITNLDVLKLTVSGSAQVMQLDVVDKIISDAAHFNLLTASKLAIIPGEEFPDPSFLDEAAWVPASGVSLDEDSSMPGGRRLTLTGTGGQVGRYYGGLNGRSVPLEAGAQYRVRFTLRRGGSAPGVNNVTKVHFYVRGNRASDGAVATAFAAIDVPATSSYTYGVVEGVVTVPEDWAGMGTVGFYTPSVDTTGVNLYFGGVSMKRMVGGVLIENGAVTADKVQADLAMANRFSGLMATFGEAFIGKVKADYVDSGSFTGKLFTGGTFTGSTFRTAASGQRVQMDSTGLTRWRSDGEGGLIRSINVGGSDADELALYDAQGRLLSGLMSDGSGVVRGEHSVGSLRVGGDRLEDMLARLPQGVLAIHKSAGDSNVAGSAELGYITSGSIPIRRDRMYRFVLDGIIAAQTAGDRAQVWIMTWDATNGVVRRQMGQKVIPTTTGDTIHVETTVRGWINGATQVRVSFQNATANRGIFFSGRVNYPTTFVVEDVGPADLAQVGSWWSFGTPLSGGTPTNETGAQTYTKTYDAAWTRSWRGGTVVSDFLHHGHYGGLQRYSMVGFPSQMATDLAGATIQKVEIYLDNEHWWGSSGTALIGRSTATSAPASPQTSGGAVFTASGWPRGAARWVTAPAGWWSASHRAITLGEGVGTSTTNYGKFANSLSAVKIRVTYAK